MESLQFFIVSHFSLHLSLLGTWVMAASRLEIHKTPLIAHALIGKNN